MKLLGLIAVILVAFAVLAVIAWWVIQRWDRRQRAIERQRAEDVEDVIAAKAQRIQDEVINEPAQGKWDELEDIASGSRRR